MNSTEKVVEALKNRPASETEEQVAEPQECKGCIYTKSRAVCETCSRNYTDRYEKDEF